MCGEIFRVSRDFRLSGKYILSYTSYILLTSEQQTDLMFTKFAKGPAEVSYWQKSHRCWRDQPLRPPTKQLSLFVTEWWSWWDGLQPVARGTKARGRSIRPTETMDLSTLRNPGRNGMLLIMVSLAWWRSLAGSAVDWRRAVVDVNLVLTCLCSTNSGTAERTNDNPNENDNVTTAPATSRKRKSSLVQPAAGDKAHKKARPTRRMPARR